MRNDVTHPEQRGVTRHREDAVCRKARGGRCLTHTHSRGSDRGHLFASCGEFPVKEEVGWVQLDDKGPRWKPERSSQNPGLNLLCHQRVF